MKQKWTVILGFMLFFSMAPMALEYWYLKSTTTEYWFHYDAIQVNDEVVFDDQTIEVLSFAEIKRPVLIQWNDQLFCNHGSGYQFTASNESSNYYTKPIILPRVDVNVETQVETLVPWRFDTKNTLREGDKCYITSTITAKLAYGIERQQVIKSNDFVVK